MSQADTHDSRENSEESEHTKPDGAAAFDAASEMEDDLLQIENLAAALRLIASSDECSNDQVGDALHGISAALEQHVQSAKTKCGQIFHQTWGYAQAAKAVGP